MATAEVILIGTLLALVVTCKRKKDLTSDPVEAFHQTYLIEKNEPERWKNFKTRYEIPEDIRLSKVKLLNSKLAVFFAFDNEENKIIIIDKNENLDLSDDEVFTVSKKEMSNKIFADPLLTNIDVN